MYKKTNGFDLFFVTLPNAKLPLAEFLIIWLNLVELIELCPPSPPRSLHASLLPSVSLVEFSKFR